MNGEKCFGILRPFWHIRVFNFSEEIITLLLLFFILLLVFSYCAHRYVPSVVFVDHVLLFDMNFLAS